MKPTVTVVTPCFNGERYLRATIDSVRCQIGPDWELVVVDDGSTDGSLDIARIAAAADQRISVIAQPNSGVHVARQVGAESAAPSSRYLVFLDADDVLEPDFLASLSTHLDEHPRVGLVYGACRVIDSDGDLVGEPTLPARYVRRGIGVRTLPDNQADTPLEALVSRYESVPSSAMLRRSVFERTLGWREAAGIEDKDMAIQMALLAPIHFVPRHLTNYRRHDANRSLDRFWERMDELHQLWWNDVTLGPGDRRAIRRSIAFDKRVSAHLTARVARDELAQRSFGPAAASGARATKRAAQSIALTATAVATRRTQSSTGSGDRPRNPRVLALHLTHPASSEANVLANVLRHLDDDIEAFLVVNANGADASTSRLNTGELGACVAIRLMDVGLPIDPTQPESRVRRFLARALHPVRRLAVIRFARDERIDVVYTSQQRFDCHMGALIARRLGIPHVIHLHYRPGPALRPRTMRHLANAAGVITVSEYIGRLAIEAGIDARRITVVPNTIEIPEDRLPANTHDGADRHGVVIGQTGRMSDDKGFDDSLDAFARVHAVRPHTSLLLVGDGSHRPTIEGRVRELGLNDAVQLVGWQDDISIWLTQMDVFIHPSRHEPFGLAILEASAHGLPVVAYLEGGVSEVVEQGHTGHLVAPGDIDALASALITLVDDTSLRERIGAAGRMRAAEGHRPVDSGRACSVVFRDLVARRIDSTTD